MRFTLTLYVQKHANGTWTAQLVEAPSVTAHATSLERCRNQIRRAMQKRVREMEPDEVGLLQERRREHKSVYVNVQLTSRDKKGRARSQRVPLRFFVLLSQHEGNTVVLLPKLNLTFLIQKEEDLERQAEEEVNVYFHGDPAEEILEHALARKEYIEAFSFTAEPQSAQGADKDRKDKDLWALGDAGEDVSRRLETFSTPVAHGNSEPLQEMIDMLSAPARSSILLIGPSGSGKTALVDELARRIARKDVPEELHKRNVWRLNAQRIEALPIWWEGSMKNIVDECRQKNWILHVTNIFDLLEGATTFTRSGEMARFLQDFIRNGDIVLIGEAVPDRFSAHASSAGGFLSLFKTIRLQEPSGAPLRSILAEVRKDLELRHKAAIEPGAIDQAIDLTGRFLPYQGFPGKAAALLQRIVSRRSPEPVRPQDVAHELSLQTGLPRAIIDDTQRLNLKSVRQFFESRLVGQPDAIDAVVDLISLVKAGLTDPQKPLGTFLMVGPTGTGKTFLARCLAEYLFGNADRLVRADMSEYSGYDAVERLTGGLGVGQSRTGTLASKVIEQPFSVVLLDEIEKASPSIFDVLLQLIGEGRLTDSKGVTVNFCSTVVLMTSNLGASKSQAGKLGFGLGGLDLKEFYRSKIEEFFRPEFVNRIDQVIVYRPLQRQAMHAIVRRELDLLLSRQGLTRRQSAVEVDDGAVELLIERGFDARYGARPLKRAVESLVATPLARYLASRAPGEMLLLRVMRDGDQTRLEPTQVREARARVRTSLPGISEIVPGNSQRKTVRELLDEVAGLRRKLRQWNQSDKVAQLRASKNRLLKKSAHKSFYQNNDEQQVRQHMRRIYHAERLLKRLDQLLSEAQFLEELTELLQREKDARLLKDVCRKYEWLQIAVGFLEIELSTSSDEHNDHALIVFQKIGADPRDFGPADWLRSLVTAYARWFQRKGYTYDLANVRFPGKPDQEPRLEPLGGASLHDVLERLSELNRPSRILCTLEGANVYGFIQAEEGIHRLRGRLGKDDPGQVSTRLVRLYVIRSLAGISCKSWFADTLQKARQVRESKGTSWEAALEQEEERQVDEVVRTYRLSDRSRSVEDPRTGLELSTASDVLEGELDPFVLAYLRSRMLDERKSWAME